MKERVQEQRNKLEYLSSCVKDIQNSRMAVNHCLFLIRILCTEQTTVSKLVPFPDHPLHVVCVNGWGQCHVTWE